MSRTLTAILVTLSLLFASCASTTIIQSEPAGAQLRIDGQPVGATPVTFTENAVWLWSKHTVQLDAKGYQPLFGSLNAQPSALYIVLGFLCLFPFFFVGEYKPTHYYVLAKQQSAALLETALSAEPSIDFE